MAINTICYLGKESEVEMDAGAQYVLGIGTLAAPVDRATADMKAVRIYTSSSAASGDNRGLYLWHYLSGGGGGDAARINCLVDSAVGTAHGLHAGMEFSAGGSLTGLGVGVRGTIMLKAGTAGGTLAGVMGELYANAATSNASRASCFRAVLAGDSDGVALLEHSAALFDIDGCSISATHMVHTSNATATHGINIRINGVDYELLANDL